MNLNEILLNAATIIITLVAAYLFTHLLHRLVDNVEVKRKLRPQVVGFIKTLSTGIVYTVAVLTLLSIFVLSIEIVIVLVAGFVIGLLISVRDVLSNLVSYYALLTSSSIRKGEVIEIGNVRGRMLKRGHLFTEIQMDEGVITHVPNNLFLRDYASIHSGSSLVKAILSIRVEGSVDISKAEDVLHQVLDNYREITRPPNPLVNITDIRREYTEFTITTFVTNLNKSDFVTSDLRKRLRTVLNESGIKLF